MTERQEAKLNFLCHGTAAFFEERVRGSYDMSVDEAAAMMYSFLPK